MITGRHQLGQARHAALAGLKWCVWRAALRRKTAARREKAAKAAEKAANKQQRVREAAEALHAAAERGHGELGERLLLQPVYSDSTTCLHRAIWGCRRAVAEGGAVSWSVEQRFDLEKSLGALS